MLCGRGQGAVGEQAGGESAKDPGDAVHAEHVEAVIVAELLLETVAAQNHTIPAASPIAERGPGQHEARRRRDRHQARHRAGDRPEHRRLAAQHPLGGTQASVAAPAAICVASTAMPARPPAASAPPALKPNQPTHSSEAPTTASARLYGAMFSCR